MYAYKFYFQYNNFNKIIFLNNTNQIFILKNENQSQDND